MRSLYVGLLKVNVEFTNLYLLWLGEFGDDTLRQFQPIQQINNQGNWNLVYYRKVKVYYSFIYSKINNLCCSNLDAELGIPKALNQWLNGGEKFTFRHKTAALPHRSLSLISLIYPKWHSYYESDLHSEFLGLKHQFQILCPTLTLPDPLTPSVRSLWIFLYTVLWFFQSRNSGYSILPCRMHLNQNIHTLSSLQL